MGLSLQKTNRGNYFSGGWRCFMSHSNPNHFISLQLTFHSVIIQSMRHKMLFRYFTQVFFSSLENWMILERVICAIARQKIPQWKGSDPISSRHLRHFLLMQLGSTWWKIEGKRWMDSKTIFGLSWRKAHPCFSSSVANLVTLIKLCCAPYFVVDLSGCCNWMTSITGLSSIAQLVGGFFSLRK